MPIICPVCGKDDYMQKVSSIVFLGTSVGEFSGKSGGFTYSNGKVGTLSTTSSISGVTSTHLAQLLAAPRLPDVPAGSTFEKLLRVFGIFLGTSILLSLIPNFSVSGLIFPVIIIFISLYGWKNVDGKYKTRLDNWKI